MDDVADLIDALLVDAVGGGIGHHQGSQLVFVGLHLLLEVLHVDVALAIGAHCDDLHARHDGRGRVGAVGGDGDNAHIPVGVAICLVEATDGHEAGILSGGAGVRLQGHGIKAGDGAQLRGEGVEHGLVALRLVGGAEGVQAAELGPCHRDHLRGGIELHGAAAQRDHGMHQRQVLVLQPFQVAQHLMLRVVEVEDGLLQEGGRAGHGANSALHAASEGLSGEGDAAAEGKDGEELVEVLHLLGLIKGDADCVGVHHAEVHPLGVPGVGDGLCLSGGLHGDGVKERLRGHRHSHLLHALGKDAGEAVDALGDGFEAGRAVVDSIHGRHVGQQRLGSADVGGRLVAADVLLARLHGHAQRWRARRVEADANDAAGHQPLVLLGGGEEGGMGAAVAHGDAKALGRAHNNVSAPLAGGSELGESQQVGGHHHLGAGVVGCLDNGRGVRHGAIGGGVLDQHAAHLLAARSLDLFI
mmetsp:Transcript_38161/g.107835  ORF Transcript_38161/g.107835 Transcript_38161/m.107835 type:complete len:471 (+) Transcript_38161:431-1843(+)